MGERIAAPLSIRTNIRQSVTVRLGPYLRNSRLVMGASLLLVLFAVALAAPILAPYDPLATNLYRALEPPSASNLLGTDQFGRDVLSRLIWGARISLQVAISVVILSLTVGTTLGCLAGFLPRWVDLSLMFVIDILLAFPGFLFALALIASRGSSLENVILAISIAFTPRVAVVTRAVVKTIAVRPYIESARAVGCTTAHQIVRHVLPNTFPPTIVIATVSAGTAILSEAGLSFLGIGIQPPTPTWGNVIADGRAYLQTNPWISLSAGLFIAIGVIALNVLGDGFRDTLDPQLRNQTGMGKL